MVEGGLLQPGNAILTSDQEHAGGLMAWKHYVTSGMLNITVVKIKTPPESAEEGWCCCNGASLDC